VLGSWDNHLYAYALDSGRTICSFVAHDDAVSCLAASSSVVASAPLLVSGSWDSTVKVWTVTESDIRR
jgi:factor associated with neutral sphingomyelinase activation